jgi:predicted RNA-binding protein with PUA-like domain
MKYWLMKSEPEEFSIDDLMKNKTSWWTLLCDSMNVA